MGAMLPLSCRDQNIMFVRDAHDNGVSLFEET